MNNTNVTSHSMYLSLAGHPLRGWPARLRGHKGSGLWKVWTVPSPPLPPLPSPALPSLPSPPSPPSLPRAKFDQAGSSRLAEARECGAALAISEWTLWSSWVQPFGRSARVWRRPGDQRVKTKAVSHDRANAQRNSFFFEVELHELWFESGLMNGPVHDLKGKWSECHRVRNAKRPREGSNSRTVPYYYIDLVNITFPTSSVHSIK